MRVLLSHFLDIPLAVKVRNLSKECLLRTGEVFPFFSHRIQVIVSVNRRMLLDDAVPSVEEEIIQMGKKRQRGIA